MCDYSISGDFGEVKFYNTSIQTGVYQSISHASHMGWHKVNELYQIEHPNGTTMDLLIMTLSGVGKIQIDDKEYSAEQGTITVIPKECASFYGGVKGEKWEFYWLHYTGAHAETCARDIVKNGEYLFKIGVEEIELLFRKFVENTAKGVERELDESEAIDRILQVLMRKSYSLQYNHSEKTIVKQIILMLEDNKNTNFCLDTLVEKYYYSKEYIIRLFKNSTGMTPYQYWQRARFKQACVSLENHTKSISEVATEFGYKNIGSFSKQFKKYMGISPTDYRKLCGICKS